ncbi:MAG: NADH-quinone oxidoreductase subunit NuoG [Nitrospirota bacterium]
MSMETKVITIYIDNKPYQVKEGQNLLQACLSSGFNIPYFCWHPAMHSVGACRLCAVKLFKDNKDTRGSIVMSCMTPADVGTRISIDDPEARGFRASVIEWLMINHPHDCPVCDEGGECHLQDMTVMTGHTYRRYRFRKRTYRNQYLGPFVNHEMNRCIQCYRCVRFYRDYAGGRDFHVFASHDHVYFGRHEDGVLENEFSGNLVEICPTGVFTDKTLKKHYTRKWDLQTAPSVCVHCGAGCNTIPGERYGSLRRIQNRYNGEVNGYFLCDRGRFGYEFVNSDYRIRQPFLRLHDQNEKGDLKAVSKEAVLQHLSSLLYFGAKVIGIGSPRASLEANFILRSLVGPEHFYLGISETDYRLISLIIDILQKGPARSASISDIELSDAVFVMGEDLTNVAPRVALALRQSVRHKPMEIARKLHIPEWNDAGVREAIQNEKGPLFIATTQGTRLDDIATETYHAAPDDLARLGFAVAHDLDPEAPEVTNLPEGLKALAGRIADSLKRADHPLVVSGSSCGSEELIKAAANVAWALCKNGKAAEISFVVPECNSLGLVLLGGSSLNEVSGFFENEVVDTVFILENDLYQRIDRDFVNELFSKVKNIVVIDHLFNPTTSKASVVLPAGTFAESTGTLINNEGRAQRSFKVFLPEGPIQESWRWLLEILKIAGRPESKVWRNFDDITSVMANETPIFKGISEIAPSSVFRIAGLKIPRQPHRYSGRTSMFANLNVHEQRLSEDTDSPLSFSMEGYEGQPPPSLISRFWAPGWDSVQAVNKFQGEVGGSLRGGDPGMRLIESLRTERISYFKEVPEPFEPYKEELLIVPLYHIFGSEELSVHARAIAELVPKPYLGLNPEDAKVFQLNEREEVELVLDGMVYRLAIRIIPSLPEGMAGLPVGLPGLKGVILPPGRVLLKLDEIVRKAG